MSRVGFGSYRIGFAPGLGHPESGQALEAALRKGMNLIDTSANYGNGQSEILIGRTLKALAAENAVRREGVVLVSKVGYIQGSNFELAQTREKEGRPFPEVTKFGDVWHCIHPEFIEDQIERSLARLGVETLDVYMLHNPEYMLKKFEMEGRDRDASLATFYSRMRASFACLESFVARGRIRAYGVSSNTMGYQGEDPTAVSLVECVRIAAAITPKNHFKVVQFPLNWIEVAPLALPVEGSDQSTVAYARQHGVGVLTNRPFNAMHNDGLIRLTRPTVSKDTTLDDGARKGLANWTRLSSDLEHLAHKHMELGGYEDAPLSQLVLSTLVWQPGVTAVLCGARKVRYVEDAEAALSRPALPNAQSILASIYEELEFHKD